MSFPVFNAYARYYDLLNQSKDYRGEAEYIQGLLDRYAPGCTDLLELGCGTGQHAAELAGQGYRIHGVDQSTAMLEVAQQRWNSLPEEQSARLAQSQADIRYLNLGRPFDAVVALFHVISYLPENADLEATFHRVRDHLKDGGLFLFDCWYGPAVLTDRPLVRVREWEDEQTRVTRIAEPTLYPNRNLVDVEYRILVEEIATARLQRIVETHRMRYLFKPELEWLLEKAGMRIVALTEWKSGGQAGFDTWTVTIVAQPGGHS